MTSKVRVNLTGPVASARPVRSAGGPADTGGGLTEQANANRARRQAEEKLQADAAELASAQQALRAALEEVASLRQRVLAEVEEQLLQLALHIARKVMMQEIEAGRCEIDPIVSEALRQVPVGQDVTVHLNPDDLRACGLAEGADEQSSVRYAADAGVRKGECLLETSEGVIESNVDSHLKDVAEALGAPEPPCR